MARQHQLDGVPLLLATTLAFAQENSSWVCVATPAQQGVLLPLVLACNDGYSAAFAAPHERWVVVYTVNGKEQAARQTNPPLNTP